MIYSKFYLGLYHASSNCLKFICKSLNMILYSFYMMWRIVSGVMQATLCSGGKMDKRYSPSFRDDASRNKTDRKRKREDVLK